MEFQEFFKHQKVRTRKTSEKKNFLGGEMEIFKKVIRNYMKMRFEVNL